MILGNKDVCFFKLGIIFLINKSDFYNYNAMYKLSLIIDDLTRL